MAFWREVRFFVPEYRAPSSDNHTLPPVKIIEMLFAEGVPITTAYANSSDQPNVTDLARLRDPSSQCSNFPATILVGSIDVCRSTTEVSHVACRAPTLQLDMFVLQQVV